MSEYVLLVEQLRAMRQDDVENRRATRDLVLATRDLTDGIHKLTSAVGGLTTRLDDHEQRIAALENTYPRT